MKFKPEISLSTCEKLCKFVRESINASAQWSFQMSSNCREKLTSLKFENQVEIILKVVSKKFNKNDTMLRGFQASSTNKLVTVEIEK